MESSDNKDHCEFFESIHVLNFGDQLVRFWKLRYNFPPNRPISPILSESILVLSLESGFNRKYYLYF